MTDLERRVRGLEDRVAITELLTLYGLLLDDHDFDGVGRLFVQDARFGSTGRMHVGREAIVANFRDRAALYPVSRHVVHGLVLHRLEPDAACGTVVAHSDQAGPAGTCATGFRYEDTYRRAEGRWCFEERLVRSLFALPHADLAAGALAEDLRVRWPHRPAGPADLPPDRADRPGGVR